MHRQSDCVQENKIASLSSHVTALIHARTFPRIFSSRRLFCPRSQIPPHKFSPFFPATKAAEKAARSDMFRDEEVPQGRSAWKHEDTAGEHDKDLEEDNHLNVVAAALRPQQLASTRPRRQAARGRRGEEGEEMMHPGDPYEGAGEAAYHESAADKKWQDYLFDQRMQGRYIMSNARTHV